MARRYGRWAGNPKGTPERVGDCLASVVGYMGWRSKQCSRRATHTIDGDFVEGEDTRTPELCYQHAARAGALWIPEDEEATA